MVTYFFNINLSYIASSRYIQKTYRQCPLSELMGREMDSTDFRILKILNKNSRRSYRSIAKELGISGRAVQKRVNGMLSEGFIISFEVGFDPSLMGICACVTDIKLKSEAKISRTIRELKKIPNIHFVVCGIDNTLTSMIYYHNPKELEEILERISLIEHVSNVEPGIPRSRLSTDVKISLLDWKIIFSLNHNARKRNHEIAKELEVSPKTIKRKLDRLIRNKVLFFTVDVDLSKPKGLIVYVLSVDLETGVKKKKIYNEIKNKFGNIWAAVGPVQPAIAFFMYAKSLSEIGKVMEDVKRISGLKKVNISMYTSYHKFTGWYDKQIEKMVKNT